MNRKRQREVSGFTLIELMISLAIFCIIALLTTSNVSFLRDSLVRHQVDSLFMVARYLQKRAQVTHQEQVLSFDRFASTYSFNGRTKKLPAGIRFAALPGIKGPPSSPLQSIDAPITFKSDKIIFYPQGIMQAGTVYVSDAKSSSLYALSCGVSQVSFLRKYRYDKRWILLE